MYTLMLTHLTMGGGGGGGGRGSEDKRGDDDRLLELIASHK